MLAEAGFLWGRLRGRRKYADRNLEEYDFFTIVYD